MLMYGFLLVAGKSAAKRLNKYKSYFFKNLDFLEGWSLENRQQKKLKKVYCLFLKKTYIFWKAGRWKIGDEKNWKIYVLFYLNLYFLFAGKLAAKKKNEKI